MTTILDASVMGNLQCDPNATAGKVTVASNRMATNKDFRITIAASNSRDSAETIDNGASKCFLCTLLNLLHFCSQNIFYVCSYL